MNYSSNPNQWQPPEEQNPSGEPQPNNQPRSSGYEYEHPIATDDERRMTNVSDISNPQRGREYMPPSSVYHPPSSMPPASSVPPPPPKAPRGFMRTLRRGQPPANVPPPPSRLAPNRPYRGAAGRPPPPAPSSSLGCAGLVTRLLIFGLLGFVIFGCVGLVIAAGGYFYIANDLPSAERLSTIQSDQSTRIFDRNGKLLYEIFDANSGRHTIVPPEKIPTVLKQATLATEDPTFYTNPGVDFYGVARAIYYLARYQRPLVGGSTITQQLIKTTLLTPEVTIERKVKEAILAFEVTRRYSKDQILAFYLNTINYGNLAYGIQAASQAYFKKDVSELDLAEASLLSGLPQAPALYDPCVNPDSALGRQQIVLGLMVKEGYIDDAQANAASESMTTRLASEDFIRNCNEGLTYTGAPHFVEYVRQQLEELYGPETVYRGGLQVYTSLDPEIQKIVEEEARKQIAELKARNVNSAAAVVLDPKTGEILAMLGSVDFNDKSIDGQVNVATRLRQPGSSIKPVNYLAALERGWTLATPIYDLRTEFPNGSQPPYVPVNYDGKEHGLVTVRTALANSYNIPAVKTLYFVGIPEMIATAQRLGITTFKDPNQYGLALTLGGGEVRLVELTGAYAVFANQGKRAPVTPFRKIVDGAGRTVYNVETSDAVQEQVVDPRHAYLMTSILSDNKARTPAFGANSPLKTSRPTFVKTGTTNDYKDNWTLGGTNELVVGVWVGNPRNQQMKDVSGITGAAPIWHNVVERVYQETERYRTVAPHDFLVPGGLVQAEVCNESGLAPTDSCPADHRHSEIFLDNQAPSQFDDVWVKLKIDKTNNLLANDNCPAEIVEERSFAKLHPDQVLPLDRVYAWGAAHGYPVPPIDSSPCTNQSAPPPGSGDEAHVTIFSPPEGAQVNGIVQVDGEASVPNMGQYIVEAGRAGQWVTVANGNQPVSGPLAQFDANAYGEGELDIRLTATDVYGRPWEAKVRVYVVNAPPPVVITQPPPPPVIIEPTQPPAGLPPPTQEPTQEPTRRPRMTRTPRPSDVPPPTEQPTDIPPTIEPTQQPTEQPTQLPPTEQPPPPTDAPTEQPTAQPTEQPPPEPTQQPTSEPAPTVNP